MATAQNFFNATPAPDPQLNPLMAGIAGGLQGASNYGDYQKQLAMMQYQNQQKQLTDMMNAGAQSGKAGFGQGPEGSTPMQFAGQQAYWNPNGMNPAGAKDLSQMGYYNAKTSELQHNPHEIMATDAVLKSLLSAKASMDPNFDVFKATDQYNDYMKSKFPDQTQGNRSPQETQGSQGQAQPSMAQQIFNKGKPVNPATGEATGATATPRALKLTKDVAQKYMNQFKNKKIAMQMALKDGYTE